MGVPLDPVAVRSLVGIGQRKVDGRPPRFLGAFVYALLVVGLVIRLVLRLILRLIGRLVPRFELWLVLALTG